MIPGLTLLLLAAAALRPSVPGEDGRGRFLVEQVPMALCWHGPAAVLLFEPEGWAGRAGVSLVGSAAGYGGTWLATRRLPMSRAQALLSVDMGYRGIVLGHGIDAMVKFGSSRCRVAAMWLAGAAGQVGGYFAARNLTPGRAAMVTSYTDIGIVQGMLLATVVDDVVFSGATWHAAPSWGAVPGAAVSFALGMWRGSGRDWSEDQAVLVWCGGLAGAFVPGALCYAIRGRKGRRDETMISVLGMAGSLSVATLTERVVRSRETQPGRGFGAIGMTTGGLLVGAGLGYLCGRDARAAAAGSAAGALAGFTSGLVSAFRYTEPVGRTRLSIDLGGLAGAAVTLAVAGRAEAPRLVSLGF